MDGEYYRTFIGLPVTVDLDFIKARDSVMARLIGERISWVKPRNYHITLRFLGDTALPVVQEILGALEDMSFPDALPAEVFGPKLFGPNKKPRVIWTGFRQDEGFRRLRKEVDRVLEELGHFHSSEQFTPHLTLGRIRSLKDPEMLRSVISDPENVFEGRAETGSVVFYRSILGTAGPEYRRMGEWKFGKV